MMPNTKSLSLTIQKLWPNKLFATDIHHVHTDRTNIVVAFRGMHVSPAKHSYA